MATPDSRIDQHWRSFSALRRDHLHRKIIIGIDRSHARRWLLAGRDAPLVGCATAWILVALVAVSVAGAIYLVTIASYLLAGVLAVLGFLSWRLMLHVAVARARAATLADERLFRAWFAERRLSVLVKRTGDVVWNDLPDEPDASD